VRCRRGARGTTTTCSPPPDETLAALDLAPGAWEVERLGSPERVATGPDGREGVLVDNVVAVRRI
jgi:hypothetical protein